MKKFIVSAGLVAIGAAGLHADEYAPDFTALNATKPWTVSGTLRGFYDDNFTTSPTGHKTGSAGFEFSPSVSVIVPLQQTELGLRYTYGLYYYQQRETQGSNPIDQTHEADLWVDHAFSQTLEAKIQDSFVSQQNPELTASGSQFPYRVEGNAIENIGTISSHYEMSMLFSTDVGYQNTFWDYQNAGTTLSNFATQGASLAGLLDQVDHSIWVNLNYQYLPDLSFVVGYSFTFDDYTGGELIGSIPVTPPPAPPAPPTFNNTFSSARNSISHNVYAGIQYSLTENLSILANAGFLYVDNYNLPSFDHQSPDSYLPTANISVTYTYLPGDYVQVGFTQSQNPAATSDLSPDGSITLFQETSVLYATINHQITPKLTGSLIGHYQYSTYVGGANNGAPQDWYTFGMNLAYALTPFISIDAGYNFYYLTTAGPLLGYSRNVGYGSITASF